LLLRRPVDDLDPARELVNESGWHGDLLPG